MSKIDFSKAPEGATHHVSGIEPNWYIEQSHAPFKYWHADRWHVCPIKEATRVAEYFPSCKTTPRPSEPKPYTRDEALRFLVERLDSWPTDIADAPLCPGWGWESEDGESMMTRDNSDDFIVLCEWSLARHITDFQPFVSIEDVQPATAKQPAPSGKGSPILGMVLADLTNRALEGKEKYGEPLKANNGRNALWDAYQEALDLAMYLRQAIAEQESK